MTPNDTRNLDAFEQIYSRFGKCHIVTALISNDVNQLIRSIDFKESIELKVIIKDAWQVSTMDSTCNALEWDDATVVNADKKAVAEDQIGRASCRERV